MTAQRVGSTVLRGHQRQQESRLARDDGTYLQAGTTAAQVIHVVVADRDRRLQVGLAVEHDHRRHHLGDRRNRHDRVRVLLVQGLAAVLRYDQCRTRVYGQLARILPKVDIAGDDPGQILPLHATRVAAAFQQGSSLMALRQTVRLRLRGPERCLAHAGSSNTLPRQRRRLGLPGDGLRLAPRGNGFGRSFAGNRLDPALVHQRLTLAFLGHRRSCALLPCRSGLALGKFALSFGLLRRPHDIGRRQASTDQGTQQHRCSQRNPHRKPPATFCS